MSIQFRLNALIGGLLVLALISIIAAMIVEAGPRVAAENQSILRLSHEFVKRSLVSLKDAGDPEVRLKALVDELKDLRHVRISLEGAEEPARQATARQDSYSWLRNWLSRFVSSEAVVHRTPVSVQGRDLGTVVVATQPADEISEVADDIVELAQRGLLLVVLLFAVTSFVIHRALKPVGRLAGALSAMEGGDYDIHLPTGGPPEIAVISARVNDLADALQRSRRENRWLSQKLVRVEDDERRELARELHDELGPYLFAARAGATSLKRELAKPEPDAAKLADTCTTILEQIDSLQQTNRRVLHRLRPVGLNELGLEATLRGVITMLRNDNPGVEVSLQLPASLGALDDTSALTIYRIVQEGLTNAFRHAKARHIRVTVAEMKGAAADRRAFRIELADDGIGVSSDVAHGHGLTGMSERVWALGGKLEVRSRNGGGTEIEAVIPVG